MIDRLELLASISVRSAVVRELGWDIGYHDSVGSTQDRARERQPADRKPQRLIIVANEQLQGQGTRGRRWIAPAGTALLASWLWRPAPADPALTTLLAGVAVARALQELGVGGAQLKWPNDVLLSGRKLAGILAHGTVDQSGGTLVLGVGINVHQTDAAISDDLRGRATSLAIEGHLIDRLALLIALTKELDRIVSPTAQTVALEEWRTRSTVLGRAVEVLREGQPTLSGIASDISADGALLVQTTYGLERIHAGEVTVHS